MNDTVTSIFTIIEALLAASSFGCAAHYFQEKRYFWFGMELVLGILLLSFVIASVV